MIGKFKQYRNILLPQRHPLSPVLELRPEQCTRYVHCFFTRGARKLHLLKTREAEPCKFSLSPPLIQNILLWLRKGFHASLSPLFIRCGVFRGWNRIDNSIKLCVKKFIYIFITWTNKAPVRFRYKTVCGKFSCLLFLLKKKITVQYTSNREVSWTLVIWQHRPAVKDRRGDERGACIPGWVLERERLAGGSKSNKKGSQMWLCLPGRSAGLGQPNSPLIMKLRFFWVWGWEGGSCIGQKSRGAGVGPGAGGTIERGFALSCF